MTTDSPRAAAARAVTWLFVPGDRPDRFERASGSGADEVICDLEDAVAPDKKDAARERVCRWLRDGGRGWVRINCADTAWFGADLDALAGVAGVRGVMVPKADDPEVMEAVRASLGDVIGMVALVESARGVVRAHDLARSEAVDRLAFGSVDYALDLDAAEEDEPLLLARSTLVLMSRAAGIASPIDGVTRSIRDRELIGADAGRSRRLGFGGKLCVHPAQLEPVATAFRPTPQEVAWADEVLDAVAGAVPGAVAAAGQMIDKPVVDRARRIAERAAQGERGTASGSDPAAPPQEGT